MVIVNIIGGLGNQMFQYALYKQLLINGKDAKVDLFNIANYDRHYGFELTNVFGLHPEVATKEQLIRILDNKRDFISKFRRKVFGSKRSYFIDQNFYFQKDILNLDNIYLDGFWQSEKYFIKIKDQIISDFQFKQKLDDRNKQIKHEILSNNSVSIHIRRGDYLETNLHNNICDLNYYNKAIKIIEEKISDPFYFVFSDDIQWAIENLELDNCKYISWNTANNSYIDMRLMSYCKNNIIANSSFSWWGAYLNQNLDKIVIAPSKWFNDLTIDTTDILPSGWSKISIT